MRCGKNAAALVMCWPLHAITDTADGARLALVLRVEEAEEPCRVVHHDRVGEAAHRGEKNLRLRVIASCEIEAERAQSVVHVGQDCEIAVSCDASGHIAQLFADTWRVHVED